MSNNLISLIIPVYRVEKYLNRCIDSVVNQTYQNLEIILVDDGSPDNCPQMCDDWAKKDSRIKVIHKEHAGVAAARNDALDIANGEYIGFVDSDDYIESEMFYTLHKTINENDSEIAVCGYQINDSETGSESTRIVDNGYILKKIALGDYEYGVLWNKLYKKSVIGDIRMPLFACSEDLIFNYFVFKNANIVSENSLKLYHYCLNYSGIVNGGRFSLGAFDAVEARKLILKNEMNNAEIYPYAVKGLIISSFVVLSGCILSDTFETEKNNLIKTILSYKKEILCSSMYSMNDKAKTLLLSFSPKIFGKLIKRKHIND